MRSVKNWKSAMSELRAVAQSLVDFQRLYSEMTWDTIPGNEHYGAMLMTIVEAARSALSASPEPVIHNHYAKPLNVSVRNGRLLIEIGVDVLAHAVSYSDWANPFDEKANDYIRDFAIIDAEEFARDVANAMNDEREDGSTPLSDFIDSASKAAVDDGSLATIEAKIKHGETSALETWSNRLAPPRSPGEK